MRIEVKACDLGLSGDRFGTCSVDTQTTGSRRKALTSRERAARAAAGMGFLLAAAPTTRARATWPVAVVAAWFGAAHLVAATTAFRGCPELGAIPSALLGREIATECGPWDWLDARLSG